MNMLGWRLRLLSPAEKFGLMTSILLFEFCSGISLRFDGAWSGVYTNFMPLKFYGNFLPLEAGASSLYTETPPFGVL